MRLFGCENCGQVLFFENQNCGRCGVRLGFNPFEGALRALEPDGIDWRTLGDAGECYRFCSNADRFVCNWLIPTASPERFCVACRHNRTVPDLSEPSNWQSWAKMESAKHRLFYTLLKLGLPTPNRIDDPQNGLVFDFRTDGHGPGGGKVMTGHEDGLITLAVAEADDAEREARRARMGEPYRTLLGHFRHEVGHFYWDMLIRDGDRTHDFRAIFGDESDDYKAALRRHYADGPPSDWQERFVSAYAAAHPWEDWAETWAHYLHIIDGPRNRERIQVGGSSGFGPPTCAGDGGGYRRIRRAAFCAIRARMASSHDRTQCHESEHGLKRSIPVRSIQRRDRQVELHPPTRACTTVNCSRELSGGSATQQAHQ